MPVLAGVMGCSEKIALGLLGKRTIQVLQRVSLREAKEAHDRFAAVGIKPRITKPKY